MRTIAPNEFYHIYNRGTEKRKIFLDKKDYDRFVSLLYACNNKNRVHIQIQGKNLADILNLDIKETLVEIGAYCIMPNHFHLITREKTENGTSKFMQKLLTAYTMYFNKKYERTGVLFQGKFKDSHVDTDRYLKYLISYVHLNPIKLIDSEWKEKGIKNPKLAKEFLIKYRYSSYLDFLGEERMENKIIEKNSLPQYFENFNDFEIHTTEWLNNKPFST